MLRFVYLIGDDGENGNGILVGSPKPMGCLKFLADSGWPNRFLFETDSVGRACFFRHSDA